MNAIKFPKEINISEFKNPISPVTKNSNNKTNHLALSILDTLNFLSLVKTTHCAESSSLKLKINPHFEKAKADIRKNPVSFSKDLKNINLFSENEKIALAKMALALEPIEVLKLIDNFEIQDKEIFLEICFQASNKAYEKLFQMLVSSISEMTKKRLDVPEEERLAIENGINLLKSTPNAIKILKTGFIEIQMIYSSLLKLSFLPNLSLEKQNELGKIVATKYPILLPRFIFESNLSSYQQEDLIKIAASQKNECVSSSIFLYNADDFPLLRKEFEKSISIEEIKKRAQGNLGTYDQAILIRDESNSIINLIPFIGTPFISSHFLYHKENLARISENARIEIAKIAASQKGNNVSLCINNYRISDPKALVEIAEIALLGNPFDLLSNIDIYGIKDEEALFNLAKKAAKTYGKHMLTFIPNFGFTSKAKVEELKQIANSFFSGWGF